MATDQARAFCKFYIFFLRQSINNINITYILAFSNAVKSMEFSGLEASKIRTFYFPAGEMLRATLTF